MPLWGWVSMASFFCWILFSVLSGIRVTRYISMSFTVWPSSLMVRWLSSDIPGVRQGSGVGGDLGSGRGMTTSWIEDMVVPLTRWETFSRALNKPLKQAKALVFFFFNLIGYNQSTLRIFYEDQVIYGKVLVRSKGPSDIIIIISNKPPSPSHPNWPSGFHLCPLAHWVCCLSGSQSYPINVTRILDLAAPLLNPQWLPSHWKPKSSWLTRSHMLPGPVFSDIITYHSLLYWPLLLFPPQDICTCCSQSLECSFPSILHGLLHLLLQRSPLPQWGPPWPSF